MNSLTYHVFDRYFDKKEYIELHTVCQRVTLSGEPKNK